MATADLGFQSFFQAQLTAGISDSDTNIPLDNVPTPTEGFLVIEPNVPAKREIIFYTSKDANSVTVPAGVGNGRGYDGTTATSHLQNADVIMAPVAAMFQALKDGTGLEDGAVTADKLGLGPQIAEVETDQSTSSGSYTDLSTVGPAVTVTVPASGIVLVSWACDIQASNNASGGRVSVQLSGANTVSAVDDYAMTMLNASGANSGRQEASRTHLFTGLTPGSTTFTLKYQRVGTGSANFRRRWITAVPLG
jgi:hypothetical protein